MPQQVTATPAALDLLERLRAQHGDSGMATFSIVSGWVMSLTTVALMVSASRRGEPAMRVG